VYPGDRRLAYTTELDTHPPERTAAMPVFRLMDEDGSLRQGAAEPAGVASRDQCLRVYATMMRVQVMDTVFYEAQRQGWVHAGLAHASGSRRDTHQDAALRAR
jgi:2-oxoisovalerate dehydrogenase E1 component alpha subunit